MAGAEASESTPNELPVGLTGLEVIIYAYEAISVSSIANVWLASRPMF